MSERKFKSDPNILPLGDDEYPIEYANLPTKWAPANIVANIQYLMPATIVQKTNGGICSR